MSTNSRLSARWALVPVAAAAFLVGCASGEYRTVSPTTFRVVNPATFAAGNGSPTGDTMGLAMMPASQPTTGGQPATATAGVLGQ